MHDKSMQHDQCDKWNHINWIKISSQKHEKLKYDSLPQLSSACIKMLLSNLLNKDLSSVLFQVSSKGTTKNDLDEKTTEHLKLFRKLNDSSVRKLHKL